MNQKQTSNPKKSKIGILLFLSLAAFNAVRMGIANMPRTQSVQPEPTQPTGYHILSFSNRTLVFEYNHVRYTAEETPLPGAYKAADLVGKIIPEMICPDGQECPLRASMTQNLPQNFLSVFKGNNQTPALDVFSVKKAIKQ